MTALRLFLLQPETIFTARVNMASFTYPLDAVTFDGVTLGVFGNIKRGMTVLFGTSAGADDLGRQRVRLEATSTSLKIGRSSEGTRDGEVDLADNAYITVLADYRVWAKIPVTQADGTILKDSANTYTGEVPDPHPIACPGPGFAGTVDPVTNVITVEFDASESIQFDPAVSSALSAVTDFLWTLDDGTVTVGTITDAEITVTFPPGFRYVYLTATGDNGQTHVASIPVYARYPLSDTSITDFQVTSHRITPQGQELSVRILQDIARDDYPDGTLVMMWDDDLQTEFAARLHMLFIGWHQADEGGIRTERTGNLRDAVLNCVDVTGRLKTLPGFPQRLEAGTDAGWQFTIYPNIFYYLHYLLYWHSTALEVSSLVLGTQVLNNYAFKVLGSDGGNLYDQVNSLANNVTPDHHLTCNRRGQLMLVVDPIVQHVPDRASAILDTLDETDWTEIRFGYARPPRVYQLRSYAISGGESSIVPLGALAPGDAPGQGEQYIETSERITNNQFSLNNVEGNRYARLNARYGPLTVVVPYSRLATGNDPAYMEWVRLTVASGNQPPRGLPFTNERGLVQELSIAYDYQRTGLVRTATLTWEQETSGPAAITLEIEAEA